MLLEFNVQNFRSFYKRVSFSMEASSRSEHPDHVMELQRQRILKSSVFYGANASGKSNLFKALAFMKELILNSSKESQAGEGIKVEPFLLNSQGASEPTRMEATFLTDETIYRYGFAINSKRVEKEWLYARSTKPKSRELLMFEREAGKEYQAHPSFNEGKGSLLMFLRDNTLLLSLLAQFNGKVSSRIVKYFLDTNIWNIESYMPVHTSVLLHNGLVPPDWVREFLLKADMGITGFQINEEEYSNEGLKNVPLTLKQDAGKIISFIIKTHHEYYDETLNKFETVSFDLSTQESQGTKQFFSLAGLIYVTLKVGSRLFIDELEKSLHPLLCRIIIRLFQEKETNPNGAQLVFTTHNTSLLDKSFFRRDEIWFAEKDGSCSTDLYSLVEYKLEKGKARNDSSYGKSYIRGKYGALPYINYDDFAQLFRAN
ncbi:MAG: ATP-binding protein [Candidatus Cloacimonetes bacterium]|nr:ATP-binding protein [Candidatus Cloacimonadota bacterium]